MADNVTTNPGSGGAVVRTKDRGGVETPVSLIDIGGTTGSEAIIGDTGVYMPVKGSGSAGTPSAGVMTIQGVASMTPVQIGDNSGSITVDNAGTFAVQATQSGTWTVLPGNTANTTAWLVTGTGGTFPATQSGTWNITNISGTVSLPTGAATAAKQPALGTAGTASTDVLTVQGITSMTPLLVTLSGTNNVSTVTSLSQWAGNAIDTNSGSKSAGTLRVVLATDQPSLSNALAVSQSGTWNVGTVTTVTGGGVASGATDSGNPIKVGGKYNSSLITLTDGQRGDLQLDASGFLKVNVAAGSGSNAAASSTGSAVPSSASYDGINVSGTLRGNTGVNPSGSIYAAQVDIASVAGTTLDTNSGNKSAGTVRVVIATDQPQNTNALKVDGSGATQPVSIAATVTVDTELPTAAAIGDANSATPTTPTVGAIGLVMNNAGTPTMDRQRAVFAAQDSDGTGIAAAGILGQLDDTSTATVTENQFAPVRISSRRALLVEGVASGTAQPASQSGTWTVQPGNTANTTAWLVTGTGGTFPATQSGTWNITNISGTVSLPTGAATSAKQPALGTAGTASTDVISVQGIASMTPLLVTLSGTNTVTSLSQWAGSAIDTNSGNKSAGTLRVVLATDQPQNTNALKVDGSAVTQPVSGTVSINAIPAGTNLIGQVSASAETATIYSGTTALTPKFAKISAASSGENTLVTAVSAKKIRVLALAVIASAAVNLFFDNNTDGGIFGDSTNKVNLAANGGFILPFNPVGWFQTGTVNEALRVNLSGAIGVAGSLTYVEV